MTRQTRPVSAILLLTAGLAALGACASVAPTAVSHDHLYGTALDKNSISVVRRTEFLEIAIDPAASELSGKDKASIREFLAHYTRRGHGPLVMSLPQASSNPQLAVAAVAEARAIAWEAGIEYEEISGTAHGAGSSVSEPMIIAYQVYDAVPPNCPQKSAMDFSNIDSNNSMPSLGCSVRTNLAAMIVDPGDLLGARALESGDTMRREFILEKFRQGESTASVRSPQESGAISSAVN